MENTRVVEMAIAALCTKTPREDGLLRMTVPVEGVKRCRMEWKCDSCGRLISMRALLHVECGRSLIRSSRSWGREVRSDPLFFFGRPYSAIQHAPVGGEGVCLWLETAALQATSRAIHVAFCLDTWYLRKCRPSSVYPTPKTSSRALYLPVVLRVSS